MRVCVCVYGVVCGKNIERLPHILLFCYNASGIEELAQSA